MLDVLSGPFPLTSMVKPPIALLESYESVRAGDLMKVTPRILPWRSNAGGYGDKSDAGRDTGALCQGLHQWLPSLICLLPFFLPT